MDYYVVDAFAEELFKGNPAGVCVLEESIPDKLMQKIAAENNLMETAFLLKSGEKYRLRWFTPSFEVDLCGHATLASAFVVLNYIEPGLKQVSFETVSGLLTVAKKENRYEMAFPNRLPEKIDIAFEIVEALGFVPLELYSDRDLCVVVKNEQEVKDFSPNYDKLQKLDDWLGIVITAEGDSVDFVSRFFCPQLKREDPVTGSSHSSLIPLWSEKLKKDRLVAKQLSERGGTLYCESGENVVKISGEAALYLKGEIVCHRKFCRSGE